MRKIATIFLRLLGFFGIKKTDKKIPEKSNRFYSVVFYKSDFELTPEEKAYIESIDRWLESSRKNLGPKIFGKPY